MKKLRCLFGLHNYYIDDKEFYRMRLICKDCGNRKVKYIN